MTEFKGVFVWTILREVTILIKNKNPHKKILKNFRKTLDKKENPLYYISDNDNRYHLTTNYRNSKTVSNAKKNDDEQRTSKRQTARVGSARSYLLPFLPALYLEPVSDTPDRLDILGFRGIHLDLLADLLDVDCNGRNITDGFHVPDLGKQLFLREDVVRVLG